MKAKTKAGTDEIMTAIQTHWADLKTNMNLTERENLLLQQIFKAYEFNKFKELISLPVISDGTLLTYQQTYRGIQGYKVSVTSVYWQEPDMIWDLVIKARSDSRATFGLHFFMTAEKVNSQNVLSCFPSMPKLSLTTHPECNVDTTISGKEYLERYSVTKLIRYSNNSSSIYAYLGEIPVGERSFHLYGAPL